MATVNFSVPDEVKAEFDKAFGDQNKSSIIAELMRRAVRERQLQIRRERLFRQLSSARVNRPAFTSKEVRRTRTLIVAHRPADDQCRLLTQRIEYTSSGSRYWMRSARCTRGVPPRVTQLQRRFRSIDNAPFAVLAMAELGRTASAFCAL